MLPVAFLGLLASIWPASAAAAPIEHGGLQLTGQTFDPTVSKGSHFVEFYSPYCGHCRKFAPTWKSLTLSGFDETHDRFAFAQLDCVANGDACASQKISGYPTMWLYQDGKQIEEYTSSRTVEDIMAWLTERVDKRDVVVDPVVPPVQLPHEREKQREEAILQVEKEQQQAGTGATETPALAEPPDAAAPADQGKAGSPGPQRLAMQPPQQHRASPLTANGTVIPLDQDSFDELRKPEAGPLFVKFFAPWCGHCKALAPTWKDLATALKGSVTVAEVNCEDVSKRDICRAQGVTGYPTLTFFYEGESMEYNGARSLSQMEAWVRKASAAHGVRDVSPYEFSGLLLDEDTFFLYLYPSSTPSSQVTMVQELVRSMLGSVEVFKSSAADLFHRFSLPQSQSHLLTFKAHHNQPYSMIDIAPTDSKAGLARYMKALRTPTFAEMTEMTTSMYFDNPANPLVVILATQKDAEGPKRVDAMRQIAESWVKDGKRRQREVLFTWIDSVVWVNFLQSVYGINSRKTSHSVIIAEPSSRRYFDVDTTGHLLAVDAQQIFGTLQDIEGNKLQPKSSLNVLQKFGQSTEAMFQRLFMGIGNHPFLGFIGFVVFMGLLAYGLWKWEQQSQASAQLPGKGFYVPVSRTGPKAD